MRSHRSDDIKYLAVDELNRRRYWRTGDTREDIWRRISRPKLSLFVLANNNKLGIKHFNKTPRNASYQFDMFSFAWIFLHDGEFARSLP